MFVLFLEYCTVPKSDSVQIWLKESDLKSIVSLPKDILLKLHITETRPMPVNDLKSVRYARWLVFLLINIPSRYTHVKESRQH